MENVILILIGVIALAVMVARLRRAVKGGGCPGCGGCTGCTIDSASCHDADMPKPVTTKAE